MNQDFVDLVEHHLRGELTENQTVQLAQWLDSDPAARQHFVRFATEQTDLHECLASLKNLVSFPAPRPPEKISQTKSRRPWWPTAIAACLMLTAGITLLPRLFSSREIGFEETHNQSVARVAAATQLESLHPWHVGDILPHGIVEIDSGELELLFHSGSTVLLQGPCRVDLNADRSCSLLRGRVTADVPEFDSGFTIHAPGMRVMDIGTRFGIDSDGTVSELHVLKGSVIATHTSADRGKYLSERSAVRAVEGGEPILSEIDFDPARFASLSKPTLGGAEAYIHYTFDETDGPLVLDHGTGLPGGPFPATIQQSTSSTLRMPGRFGLALALDGQGMTMKSTYPGIGGDAPRTLAMWVKLPPSHTARGTTRSLSSWGAPGVPGEHWLVGIYNSTRGERLCTEFTGGRIEGRTPLDDGKWHHVVSIFYGGSAERPADRIEHYIDGQLEISDIKQWTSDQTKVNTLLDRPNSLPLTLGLHPYHKDATTQVLVDEFHLFDRALKPGEIQSLFRTNRLDDSALPR